ncbi:MAG: hypothetical protein VB934_22775, partial [Polyangiaceae bacterium]
YEPIPKPSEQGCELGPKFDAWFARCCARDPKARFASATAAIDDLAAALGVSEENLTTMSRSWIGLEQAKQVEAQELALTATALTRTRMAVGSLGGDGRKRGMLIVMGTAAVAIGAALAWLNLPRASSSVEATSSSPPVLGSGRSLVLDQAVASPSHDASAAPSVAMPTATSSASAALSAEPKTPGDPGALHGSSSARSGPGRRPVRSPRPRQASPAVTGSASPASGASAAPVKSQPPAKPVDPLAGRH